MNVLKTTLTHENEGMSLLECSDVNTLSKSGPDTISTMTNGLNSPPRFFEDAEVDDAGLESRRFSLVKSGGVDVVGLPRGLLRSYC